VTSAKPPTADVPPALCRRRSHVGGRRWLGLRLIDFKARVGDVSAAVRRAPSVNSGAASGGCWQEFQQQAAPVRLAFEYFTENFADRCACEHPTAGEHLVDRHPNAHTSAV
jgi:hypothetical protein